MSDQHKRNPCPYCGGFGSTMDPIHPDTAKNLLPSVVTIACWTLTECRPCRGSGKARSAA